jgi:hypothetical protein
MSVVWVLIFYGLNGFVVVDNISSKANCEALATIVHDDVSAAGGNNRPHRCVAVRKA